MAESDDFVRSTLSSILQPGEVILSMGWMAPCSSGWRDQYDRYFGVGTTGRFIVIQTRRGMGTIPKLENLGITWMDYAAMETVGTRRFSALSDSLLIKGTDRKLDYCVPAPTIIGAKAMDGHAQFNELYILWLSRHVAAGSFRTPAGAHAAAAEWQHPAAINDANIRFAPKSMAAARRNLQRRVKWPFWLALTPILLIFMAGKKFGHGRTAEAEGKQIILLAFGLIAACFILGIVLNLRKRTADKAADQAAADALAQPR